jgi:hypothetical protein
LRSVVARGPGRPLSTDGNSRHPASWSRKRLRTGTLPVTWPTAASESRRFDRFAASPGGRLDASCTGLAPIWKRSAGRAPHSKSRVGRGADGGFCVNRSGLMGALTRGALRRRRGEREHVSSLDTSRCSDMFNRPEKAENTRVFGSSARQWMRPRRRLTGMQRTHRADPSRIWTGSDQLLAWAQPLRSEALGHIDRVVSRFSSGWNREVPSIGGQADRPKCPRIERTPLRSSPRTEDRFCDGMGLALRITQMVPRLWMEPQNAEGARR